jgi:hypothetical protein
MGSKITRKKLESLGIYFDKKIDKSTDRYLVADFDQYILVSKNSTFNDIILSIYDIGRKQGIQEGKSMMRQDFRDLLGIPISFTSISEFET